MGKLVVIIFMVLCANYVVIKADDNAEAPSDITTTTESAAAIIASSTSDATTPKPSTTPAAAIAKATTGKPASGRAAAPRGRKIDFASSLANQHQEPRSDYKFSYRTEDGQKRNETGHVENQGTDTEKLVVRGRYSFVDRDGFEYIVTYISDNKGFRPIIDVKRPKE